MGRYLAHIGWAIAEATLVRERDANVEGAEPLKIDPAFLIEKFMKIVLVKSAVELKHFPEKIRIAGRE